MSLGRQLRSLDWLTIAATVALIGVGLVFIYSATSGQPVGGDPQYYLKRQAMWAAISLGAMVATILVDYRILLKLGPLIYGANLLLLTLVLVAGSSAYGAQRWLDIGPARVQPSEFAKVAMIIGFASFLAERRERADTSAGTARKLADLLPSLLYVGLPTVLVFRQPDLGTSLVFVAIFLGMLYVAGSDPKVLFGLTGGAVGLGALALFLHNNFGLRLPLKDYQVRRIMTFLRPGQDLRGTGYHTHQSQIAIGSGRLFGQGLMAGSQNQLNFLPMRHTDFIFSVIGEEFGFAGTVAVLLLFMIIIWRGVVIAARSQDLGGSLLVVGVLAMLGFHVLVNVGMATGVMPVTGLPLPFLSSGGSSLFTNCVAIGLMLNVGLRRYKIHF